MPGARTTSEETLARGAESRLSFLRKRVDGAVSLVPARRPVIASKGHRGLDEERGAVGTHTHSWDKAIWFGRRSLLQKPRPVCFGLNSRVTL